MREMMDGNLERLNEFINYVYGFYGEGGLYEIRGGPVSRAEVLRGVMRLGSILEIRGYKNWIDKISGESYYREEVRELMNEIRENEGDWFDDLD